VAALFALVLWTTPLGLYVTGLVLSLDDARTTHERALWITNVVSHILTGALVLVDTLVSGGRYWPLQMAIIGLGSYTTFTLPALGALALIRGDSTDTAVAFASLGSACLANAAMLGILFELFHRSRLTATVYAPVSMPSLAAMRRG
jgi:predicted permease